jgi:hypothetical protein
MPTKFQIDDRVKIAKVNAEEDDKELQGTIGFESTIVCVRRANGEIIYELSAINHPILDEFVYTDDELEKVE